jgi:hypothetical protein
MSSSSLSERWKKRRWTQSSKPKISDSLITSKLMERTRALTWLISTNSYEMNSTSLIAMMMRLKKRLKLPLAMGIGRRDNK